MTLRDGKAPIIVSAAFDGGNIECIHAESADNIELKIRKDNDSDFCQWFYFRVSGVRGRPCTLRIVNAHEATYTDGWQDYRAVASTDRQNWTRIDTSFDGRVLTLSHTPSTDAIYFAYFAPYSMERHADLVARCLTSPFVHHDVLGQTIDGQDIDRLVVASDAKSSRTAWIIARQHPGETMAEWWMEGFLNRLLDANDPVARKVREKITFHIVPNMNPDGSRRGHLRTNAVGCNLNRAWQSPSMEKSPEVYVTRNAMELTGVDFCLDVHGDEGLPYN
ncbi:MAG: M14-type cytosolic carboxypeptidase, partial [Myxococcota bacterium]